MVSQTIADWFSTVSDSFEPVFDEDSNVFTLGLEENLSDDKFVSLTVTEQSDYYEAYVVAEYDDIEQAKEEISYLRDNIGTEDSLDKTVGVERDERWAEMHFRVDEEKFTQ